MRARGCRNQGSNWLDHVEARDPARGRRQRLLLAFWAAKIRTRVARDVTGVQRGPPESNRVHLTPCGATNIARRMLSGSSSGTGLELSVAARSCATARGAWSCVRSHRRLFDHGVKQRKQMLFDLNATNPGQLLHDHQIELGRPSIRGWNDETGVVDRCECGLEEAPNVRVEELLRYRTACWR